MHTFVRSVAASLAAIVSCAAFSSPPPGPDALTEFGASQWQGAADDSWATLDDDTSRVAEGASSLRFDTGGPFDTWLWTTSGRRNAWDLSASGGLRFWVYAENPNCCGFQGNSPWIRLFSGTDSYVELHCAEEVLNQAIGQWIECVVPFAGNEQWLRSETGSPDLAAVTRLEIHADTWEAGFSLWFDGFSFDVPIQPPEGLRAYAGNHVVTLQWKSYLDPAQAINVYRSFSPITNVAGMTPLATLAPDSTAHVDATALNDVRYHYAVTAVTPAGETVEVESVGPRTPRDETDLQVVSIARTPRYPRYAPSYTGQFITEPNGFGPYWFSAATGLDLGQNENTQRFPLVGDPVTYVATIRNRGTNPWTAPISATWTYDGVESAVFLPSSTLAPGETTTVSLVRPWPTEPVVVDFGIDIEDARDVNDRRSIASDSVAFLSFADRTYIENFRESSADVAGMISDDLFDWVQFHMDRFNLMFAEADCGKRVHYDVLEMLDDEAPDPSVNTIEFGIFPFRYRAGDGSLRLSGYYDPTDDLDYGLLHELAHQLGLIDIYQLDLPSDANQVNGEAYSAVPCLMHGVSHFLSLHSANAMDHWLHVAHGYYGQYLYGLPGEIGLRIVGANGEPLDGATVRVYQKAERPNLGNVITNQVKFEGTTDGQGIFMLPNVPLNTSLVPPTLIGDTLGPNPFGYVAVVGTNGLFLIEVARDGFTEHVWLDITECNNAWFAGTTGVAIFERHVAIGGDIQHYPPAELTELNAADWGWTTGDGAITLSDDSGKAQVGVTALKAEVTGGFDNAISFPDPNGGSFVASWDLSGVEQIRAKFYAENPNFGFQDQSPWFRLVCSGGLIDLRCCELLNEALWQWIDVTVPLAGDGQWQRTEIGSPDITQVHRLEMHADTWGYGFTLWADGVGFEPNPMRPILGDLDHDDDVDAADLAILLGAWGTANEAADLDQSGVVNASDLAILLGAWQA
ncbi:MAG: hypothetical protein JNL80_04085 [Phycisphaerae bacterium]|nr:hypothetical protein [Phycisphaerae bacterium]